MWSSSLLLFATQQMASFASLQASQRLFPSILNKIIPYYSFYQKFICFICFKNSLIAPQLVYLEENSWRSIGAILCFLFALSSIIVTILFMPETKGRNLPENLLEVHLHEQEEAAKSNKENWLFYFKCDSWDTFFWIKINEYMNKNVNNCLSLHTLILVYIIILQGLRAMQKHATRFWMQKE